MRPLIRNFLERRFDSRALSLLDDEGMATGKNGAANGRNGNGMAAHPARTGNGCSKLIEFFADADLAIANAITSGQSVREAAQQWIFHTERWLHMKVEGKIERLVLDAALIMDETELVEQEIGRFGDLGFLGAAEGTRARPGSDPFVRIVARSIVDKIGIVKETQRKLDAHKIRLAVQSRPYVQLQEKLASEEAMLERTVLGASKSPIIITARSSGAAAGRSHEEEVARLREDVARLERTVADMRDTDLLREANHRAEVERLIAERQEADEFARHFSEMAEAARAKVDRVADQALADQVSQLKAALRENEAALDELYLAHARKQPGPGSAGAEVDSLLHTRAERHRRELVVLKELTLVSRQRWSWLLVRPVRALEVALQRLFKWDTLRHSKLIARSGYFDAAWYLKAFPDVATAGLDPFEHFLRHGLPEKRDPGPHFSNARYLQDNPDVAQSGAQPFIHYLTCGVIEGRVAYDSAIKLHG